MINIISTQARHSNITGPAKVFRNLVKGLDKIGYPYVINRDLNATKRLWIHDDLVALRHLHYSKSRKVVGPNLVVMPGDLPPGIKLDDTIYIQPSDWVVGMWRRAGFDHCSIKAWPVGIDTDEFSPSSFPMSERQVLMYFKRRDPQGVVSILETLANLHLPTRLIIYGTYTEAEFKQLLNQTSLIIWYGRHESQGIALLEALACDLPMIVCDATSVAQEIPTHPYTPEFFNFPVTSAPFFNAQCGLKITDLNQLRLAITEILDTRARFHPRAFILESLSLESQARAFVALWEHWQLSFEDGRTEQCLSSKAFSPTLAFRINQLGTRVQRRLRQSV